MQENQDIFDKLMSLPGLRHFRPLFDRFREPLLYVLFGALTTLINILIFWLLTSPAGMGELVANIIAWIAAVLFAYVTNRKWVFTSADESKSLLRQLLEFYAGRLLTLGVEELMLYVFITRMGLNAMLIKIIAQIVVIVLNFVISKLLVFRKKRA